MGRIVNSEKNIYVFKTELMFAKRDYAKKSQPIMVLNTLCLHHCHIVVRIHDMDVSYKDAWSNHWSAP